MYSPTLLNTYLLFTRTCTYEIYLSHTYTRKHFLLLNLKSNIQWQFISKHLPIVRNQNQITYIDPLLISYIPSHQIKKSLIFTFPYKERYTNPKFLLHNAPWIILIYFSNISKILIEDFKCFILNVQRKELIYIMGWVQHQTKIKFK